MGHEDCRAYSSTRDDRRYTVPSRLIALTTVSQVPELEAGLCVRPNLDPVLAKVLRGQTLMMDTVGEAVPCILGEQRPREMPMFFLSQPAAFSARPNPSLWVSTAQAWSRLSALPAVPCPKTRRCTPSCLPTRPC